MNTFLLVSKRQEITGRRIKIGAETLSADLERARLRQLSEIERSLTRKELCDLMWLMLFEYCDLDDWRPEIVIRKLADRRVKFWMRHVILLLATNLNGDDRRLMLWRVENRYPFGPPRQLSQI